MKSLIISCILISLMLFTNCNNGNYSYVTIGDQKWMSKNLDVDHYANGDPIPQIRNDEEWRNLKTGAWCYFKNDSIIGAVYGKLYNWYAVNDPRGLAPKGWHIPNKSEWVTLIIFLGGEDIAGGKMKETGTNHWLNPNMGATNSSGFNALGSCLRYFTGDFYDQHTIGFCALFWSSTQTSNDWAYSIDLGAEEARVIQRGSIQGYGLSVRCIKDK